VTNPYTLDEIVAAVDAAVPAGEPLAVLGWSLGGAVAMAWALAQPARVARLALVCTSPRFVAGPDWPHAMGVATLSRFGDELAVAYRITLQRFLSLQLHGSDQGRAALALMRKHLFARGEPAPEVLGAALRILGAIDLRAGAASIVQPTWVIAGDRDTLAPAAAGRWLAAAMPDATYAEIAGAGHAPFLSHPEAFHRALQGFVDGR
jgi:pimeloyl-[acyl-carrier protein] methyl ester esterase